MIGGDGAIEIAVPRDRNGSFEPQIVAKGQTQAFVSWKDRKLIMPDLKAIYRAESRDWGYTSMRIETLAGVPISRDWDQPRTNGGNYFAFDLMTFRLLHGWRSIDTQHVTSYYKREDRTK